MITAEPAERRVLRTEADYETGAYKWYVALVLCVAHAVSIMDRFVIVLVNEPIRAAMSLSDTQLGLLQGTGFAILYCAFAIPIGAIADVTNRRNLIIAGVTLWSCATLAAAFTSTFEMLFLTRVLVGLGEACLIPAGMSLLATYFSPANLARGTAIFGLGANFGLGIVFLGGGAVLAMLIAGGGLLLPGYGQMAPWQGVFVFAGLAAVPALIMLFWLREPPRRNKVQDGLAAQFAGVKIGLVYMWRNIQGYAPFLVVGSLTALMAYSVTAWSSSLLIRVHGFTVSDAGLLIGIVGVSAGPIGTLLGGVSLDRMRAHGVVGAPLVIMGLGGACMMAMLCGVVFVSGLTFVTVFFALFIAGSTFVLPSLYVGMQMITPDRFRGIAASTNMMFYTMCGLGLGPTLVGIVSDLLPQGETTLGVALIIVQTVIFTAMGSVVLMSRQSFDRRVKAILANA